MHTDLDQLEKNKNILKILIHLDDETTFSNFLFLKGLFENYPNAHIHIIGKNKALSWALNHLNKRIDYLYFDGKAKDYFIFLKKNPHLKFPDLYITFSKNFLDYMSIVLLSPKENILSGKSFIWRKLIGKTYLCSDDRGESSKLQLLEKLTNKQVIKKKIIGSIDNSNIGNLSKRVELLSNFLFICFDGESLFDNHALWHNVISSLKETPVFLYDFKHTGLTKELIKHLPNLENIIELGHLSLDEERLLFSKTKGVLTDDSNLANLSSYYGVSSILFCKDRPEKDLSFVGEISCFKLIDKRICHESLDIIFQEGKMEQFSDYLEEFFKLNDAESS